MGAPGTTPGPWTTEDRLDGGYIREATPWDETGGIKRRKAVALVRISNRTPEENAANAAQIAASSAMYDALFNAVALWRGRCTDDVQMAWLEEAEATLALARGEA